jgi:hypothetical protein
VLLDVVVLDQQEQQEHKVQQDHKEQQEHKELKVLLVEQG